MSWIDELDSGPLAAAARELAPDLPQGPEGLRRLLQLIEAHLAVGDPSDDDERAFVEGAGAVLAVLLIAHAGDGAWVERDGVHRIRLGGFGYFDPFGAMEAVLDADDPRAALASAVRRAEAEARGEGATSRVLSTLADSVAALDPPLAIREHFERYVKLSDETEIDLARVVDATRDGDDDDVQRSVDKLLSFVGTGQRAVAWAEAESRLLPRLVPIDFEARLPESSSRRGRLAIRPFRDSLNVGLILSYDGRARFVREDEIEGWERQFDDALISALSNLAGRSTDARFVRVETDAGPLVVARSGDGLDAARLLLPGLHEVLSPELGSRFFASVPHRDTLLASPTAPPALVETLERRTREDARKAPHRISEALYVVGPDGVSDVPEP